MKCDKCRQKSVILLPYGPHYFCKKHFLQFFEKRIRKTIRLNHLVKGNELIAVGVSGGKDSVTTLHILASIFGSKRLHAVMVDEGIKGYRDKALKAAKANCEVLNVPFTEVSFKDEIDFTMTEVASKIKGKKELGKTCSYCGVFRRHLLNKTALKLGAGKIATGHNLDDEVQSIVMNLFDNNLERMSRMGAIAGVKRFKEFVPRIKPLYETPEKEVIAFVNFKNLKHYSDECCPFSWQAKRNDFRKLVDEMELKYPGTKYSILNAFKALKPELKSFNKSGELQKCIECGNPCSGKTCQACKQLKKLENS